MAEDLDTSQIKNWRSIVTLIVFCATTPRQDRSDRDNGQSKYFVRLRLHLNFVTAPLIADLFLLAILAIGRQEVHDGTIGADNISPIDIMLFFLSLAYIAISIDASGLIRYLAFKVLQWGGDVGHRLFFYLYTFFFGLAGFIGNDPIILSGTAFLAYMTRVSSNIKHPRAWIFTQFALANIASAILVSSNPTNLVLAGAFDIKFIEYTANMIVPVVITAIVLFPFLLYILFADEDLIPTSIKMHELPESARRKTPVNPNIPHAKGATADDDDAILANDDTGKLLSLEEIMNPFLDKGGAAFGAVVMAATLVTLLTLDAASARSGKHPVFWVTLPAAFVMFGWDVGFGWWYRADTRRIAREGRGEVEYARVEREIRDEEVERVGAEQEGPRRVGMYSPEANHLPTLVRVAGGDDRIEEVDNGLGILVREAGEAQNDRPSTGVCGVPGEKQESATTNSKYSPGELLSTPSSGETDEEKRKTDLHIKVLEEIRRREAEEASRPRTFVSVAASAYTWSQETFPTATAVVSHLPFALVPFAFSMFVLVQALVTKGWVPVFAYGWDHWVDKTGTVGSVGGMGFLSVILCNFAGTNIGTTILLSRVIQAWQEIHRVSGVPISNRTFWATVYSMALGVNYGAFSASFSASLAGLLWRDILARKHIHARSLDFASVNLPIIAIAMTVGCVVLVCEVYIMRDGSPYDSP
ncbi:hypothetical protein SLS55_010437 [Diplodia seriata]|uniref:Citrate transporter-like domain-containing protein n=1 Tax=Diplodia seriata TaxID=420778 RepID=A0ABR3BYK1_9PEZI